MESLGIPFSRIFNPERKRGRWLYRDTLHSQDRLYVVTGDAGVGKTLWAVNLLLALATGHEFMGIAPEPDTVAPTCLYVDLDMGEELVMERFEQVGRGMGLGVVDLEERVAVLSDTWDLGTFSDGWPKLGEAIFRSGATYCVLESFLDLCGGGLDPNNNSAVNMMVQKLLRRWPAVSFMVVHHESKSKWTPSGDTKQAQHRGIGAQALTKNATRNVSIVRVGNVAGQEIRAVESGKVRTGAQPEPYRFRLEGDEQMVRLVRIEE